MNVQEANYQDLISTYFDSIPDGFRSTLSIAMRQFAQDLRRNLRSQRKSERHGPVKQTFYSAAVDSLLTGYAVMEIAILAGFIEPPDRSKFWRDAEAFLANWRASRFYPSSYRQRLPELLLLRIQGRHAVIEERRFSLTEYMLRFLELDRRFIDTLKNSYFMRILGPFPIRECRFGDVLELLAKPEQVARSILLPPDERGVPDHVVYQFGIFMQFYSDLESLLTHLRRESALLESEVWHRYSSSFGRVYRELNEKLKAALEQFLKWQPSMNDPRAAAELHEYVSQGMLNINNLTSPGHDLEVEAAYIRASGDRAVQANKY